MSPCSSDLSQGLENRGLLAIVFDVGGVLVHPSGNRIVRVLAEALPRVSISTSASRWARIYALATKDAQWGQESKPAAGWIQDWGRHAGLPETIAHEAWSALAEASARGQHEWTDVDPGARVVLEELKSRGFILGALANAEGDTEDLLDDLGLGCYFTAIVDSSLVGVMKPDPRSYEAILRRLGAAAEQSCYVGDEIPELDGAARFGFDQSIHYDPHDVYRLATPYPHIRTLTRLLSILDVAGRK